MELMDHQTGFAKVNGARLYYEVAGEGQPFVMIHAGVADNRMWQNEFEHYAHTHRVLRFDMAGYGQSEPVDRPYTFMGDLIALLDTLGFDQPLILMGCSIGGMLALDFAIAHPERVRAVIMVGAGPGGLDIEVEFPEQALEEQALAAFEAGDLDSAAELETRIWYDGLARTPDQVDPAMRRLAFEMDRIALGHQAKNLGQRTPSLQPPAATRLHELRAPLLLILGSLDIPYVFAAADFMTAAIPATRKVIMDDAAHFPNMEHPAHFQQIVTDFLNSLPG